MSNHAEAAEGRTSTRKYTTAISKGAAMIEETRSLVRHWHEDESIDDFAERVQREGLVGAATAYRTKDIVKRVFAPRFLRPTNKPACILRRCVEKNLPPQTFSELVFLYTCRYDPLIYDFTVKEYWPAARRGKTVLDAEAVVSFLSVAMLDGMLDAQWSEKVSVRIGRCVLALLRDVGFLKEVTRGRKEIVFYRMSDPGVVLLARDLHDSGVTDSSICSHPDWQLFGLGESEVLDRLDSLGERRVVIVQRAGSVVHLTWSAKAMEEIIDVFAR